MAPRDLRLGQIVGTGRALGMSPGQRKLHTVAIGPTGKGKTSFFEHLLRQDLNAHRGLCLIDPTGNLAERVFDYICRMPLPPRNVIYLAPWRDDWITAYNPLARRADDLHFLLKEMKRATLKCWGQDNAKETPRIDEWLETAYHAGVTQGFTFPELGMLLQPNPERNTQRRALIDRIPEHQSQWREPWEQLCALVQKRNPIDYDIIVGSTARRLGSFLRNPRIERIFGVPDLSIDLARAMDEQAVIIVDLAIKGRLHPEDAELIGTLLLTDFFVQMQNRRYPKLPFNLFIDEFQNYISGDIAHSLDLSRQFGLQFHLAHQRPGQLLNHREPEVADVYSAVMNNCHNKVIFGGITPDELEPIAKHMSMSLLDPYKEKRRIYTRSIVSYQKEYWEAHSKSVTDGTTSTSGGSSGIASVSSSGSMGGVSSTFDPNSGLFGPGALHTSENSSWASHFGTSDFSGDSWAESDIHTESNSTTRFPTLVPELGDQLSAIYYEGLDEQLFQFMAVVHRQQDRHAMVQVAGQDNPLPVRIPDLRPKPATDAERQALLRQMAAQHPYFLPASRADELIADRKKVFLRMGEPEVTHIPPPPARDKMNVPEPMKDTLNPSEPTVMVGNKPLLARDIELLADIFDSRFITIPHAALLHFGGLKSAERTANRRLQVMAEAGLLARDEGHFGFALLADGRKKEIKTLYRFTKNAFDLLVSQGLIRAFAGDDWEATIRKRFGDWSPKTIRHEIGMLDIKAGLKPAIEAHAHLKVIEFGVWPLAYEFPIPKGGRFPTQRPDGFVHVVQHHPGRDAVTHHYLYIEFDTGSEKHEKLIEKAEGYRHHLRSGNFARSIGRADAKPADWPFRVLFVFDQADAEARRDNVAASLAEAGFQTHTPLTTLRELVSDPLGSILVTPKHGAGRKVCLFDGLSTAHAQSAHSAAVV